MITKYLIVSSMVSLGGGLYYYIEASQFQKKFKKLEKDQIYDFNHINQIEDLPQHKDIFLGGQVTNLNSYVDESLSEKEIIYQQPIKMISKDDDIMWSTKKQLEIQIKNKQDQTILVETEKEKQLWIYNLNDLKTKTEQSNIFHKAIFPGNYYVFQGKMVNKGEKLSFNAKIIMSENKELFLNHMDYKICQKYKKSKIFTGIAFGLLAVHFIITQTKKQQKKSQQFQKQMEQLGQNMHK